MRKHYVYIISCEGFCKVGYARDPEKRMEQMQTGCPFELQIVARLPFETEHAARSYEKELHGRLRRYRARGEWFCADGVELALRAPRGAGRQPKKDRVGQTQVDRRWEHEGA